MLRAAFLAVLAFAVPAQQAARPGSPAGCLEAARDFVADRQRAAERITAELYRQIQAEKVEMAQECAAQFDLAEAPEIPRRPAPGLGEHTREVLAELGRGPEEVEALLEAGVVEALG